MLISMYREEKPVSGWDAMLVLEHEPVYTLGRSANVKDLKGIDPETCRREREGYEVGR